MKKSKKIVAIFIVVIFVFSLGTTTSFSSRLKDISRKIDNAETKLKNDKKKISQIDAIMGALEKKIKEIEGEVIKLKGEILSTMVDIENANKKLEKSKQELVKTQGELNQRLRNMYKSGSVGFVDVMLTSENVDALLSNAELVKKIYSGDKSMVEKLKREYMEIKADKERLEKLQASLQSKQNALKQRKQAIANTKSAYMDKKGKLVAGNKKTKMLITSLHEDASDILNANEKHYSGGRYSGGNMMWPCNGSVVCGFGPRICPFHGYEIHSGIDIAASTGTPVVAAKSGRVSLAGWNGSFGNCVKIYHGGEISTLYGHNSRLLVRQGQRVKKGQIIARVGSTGNSTGPHCHFSVIRNGSYVNPMNYLK